MAVEKHKARLAAELTRARLKRGFTSLGQLRAHIGKGGEQGEAAVQQSTNGPSHEHEAVCEKWPQPRWVRVNTLKTTTEDQLKTTFADYSAVEFLDEILCKDSFSNALKLIHIDKHVPDLLALPPATDLSKTRAYLDGLIILQDKASCFPAYMLNLDVGEECLDACAAPGNKTTHLAAILREKNRKASRPEPTLYASERDPRRVSVLDTMVRKAGASDCVQIHRKDFLKFDKKMPPCSHINAVLLDPSCSGSGMLSRDETFQVTLPREGAEESSYAKPKKRRKGSKLDPIATSVVAASQEESPATNRDLTKSLQERLTALSDFQLRLLLHAFHFPKARKITYSTCSIYPEENENIVVRALLQSHAERLGWRILPRGEQIEGVRAWSLRGDMDVCQELVLGTPFDAKEISEACIRCEKGTREGTQGFFVAAFVKEPPPGSLSVDEQEKEWEGFDDD